MAKYGIGENNPVENVFSNTQSAVSTFGSIDDRYVAGSATFSRSQLTKILDIILPSADCRNKKPRLLCRIYYERIIGRNRKKPRSSKHKPLFFF